MRIRWSHARCKYSTQTPTAAAFLWILHASTLIRCKEVSSSSSHRFLKPDHIMHSISSVSKQPSPATATPLLLPSTTLLMRCRAASNRNMARFRESIFSSNCDQKQYKHVRIRDCRMRVEALINGNCMICPLPLLFLIYLILLKQLPPSWYLARRSARTRHSRIRTQNGPSSVPAALTSTPGVSRSRWWKWTRRARPTCRRGRTAMRRLQVRLRGQGSEHRCEREGGFVTMYQLYHQTSKATMA
jgi:hypothetical protein